MKRGTRKILKTLKNHREKMSVPVNVHMPKIMCMLIKLGVRTYIHNIHQLSNPGRFPRLHNTDKSPLALKINPASQLTHYLTFWTSFRHYQLLQSLPQMLHHNN